MDGIELSFAELEVGDYLVNEDVVLERKSIEDFGKSIIDTRLFRQASGLNRSPHRAAVLVEGWLSMTETAVPRAAMQGAMISLALIFDIPVLHALDRDESARLIAYAARQLGDPSQRATVWRHRSPKKPWTRRLHVLQSLPGVGRERAERLLERFGTVERCIGASEAELCLVPGIGPKTAQAIRLVVSGT